MCGDGEDWNRYSLRFWLIERANVAFGVACNCGVIATLPRQRERIGGDRARLVNRRQGDEESGNTHGFEPVPAIVVRTMPR